MQRHLPLALRVGVRGEALARQLARKSRTSSGDDAPRQGMREHLLRASDRCRAVGASARGLAMPQVLEQVGDRDADVGLLVVHPVEADSP